MFSSKPLKFLFISLIILGFYTSFIFYIHNVIYYFCPNLALILFFFLSFCFFMVELSYIYSVFKDPGYVTSGIENLSEKEQNEMIIETMKILEKVSLFVNLFKDQR